MLISFKFECVDLPLMISLGSDSASALGFTPALLRITFTIFSNLIPIFSWNQQRFRAIVCANLASTSRTHSINSYLFSSKIEQRFRNIVHTVPNLTLPCLL